MHDGALRVSFFSSKAGSHGITSTLLVLEIQQNKEITVFLSSDIQFIV
jgi:hypothetical protein